MVIKDTSSADNLRPLRIRGMLLRTVHPQGAPAVQVVNIVLGNVSSLYSQMAIALGRRKEGLSGIWENRWLEGVCLRSSKGFSLGLAAQGSEVYRHRALSVSSINCYKQPPFKHHPLLHSYLMKSQCPSSMEMPYWTKQILMNFYCEG